MTQSAHDPIGDAVAASAVSLSDVTRTFPDGTRRREVLRDITLEVAFGEMVAITGPSGSGKTTLLHLVAGLDAPTEGQVTVAGQHLSIVSATERAHLRRDTLGFVDQQLNLIEALTALENVMLPLELAGMKPRTARQSAMDTLVACDLGHLADQTTDQLSGGEQQRVAVARALVGTRRVIVADEPTGALDSLAGEGVMKLLRRSCDEGAGVLLATHNPSHAAWADRVVLLTDGQIIDDVAAVAS